MQVGTQALTFAGVILFHKIDVELVEGNEGLKNATNISSHQLHSPQGVGVGWGMQSCSPFSTGVKFSKLDLGEDVAPRVSMHCFIILVVFSHTCLFRTHNVRQQGARHLLGVLRSRKRSLVSVVTCFCIYWQRAARVGLFLTHCADSQ